jgi:hypothetical protein
VGRAGLHSSDLDPTGYNVPVLISLQQARTRIGSCLADVAASRCS